MKRRTILLLLVFQSFLLGLGTPYNNANLNAFPEPKGSFSSVQYVGISNYNDYGGKIVAYADYIYSIRNEGGFEIMDCSGSTMMSVGDFYTSLDIHDMKIEGNVLYCLTSSGFHIFDLTDPLNPIQRGSSPEGDEVIAGIEGGFAYYFDMWQLFIYQIQDLDTLVHSATLQLPIDTYIDHIEAAIVKNNYVHAITREGRLFSIDVTNNSNPVGKRELVTNDLSFVDAMVEHDNFLYVVGEPVGANGHLMIFDINNPDLPSYYGYNPSLDSYWEYDLVFDGDRFWVASGRLYLYNFNSVLKEINHYDIQNLRDQLPGVSQVLKHNGWLYMLQDTGYKRLYRVDVDANEFIKLGDSPLEREIATSGSTNTTGGGIDPDLFDIPGYNVGLVVFSIAIITTVLLRRKNL